jgi:terminase large subunit-like protein
MGRFSPRKLCNYSVEQSASSCPPTPSAFCTVLVLLRCRLNQPVLRRQRQVPDGVTLLTQAGHVPDPWQVQVLRSQATRLLLLCSRQAGKTCVAAALALGTALREPGSLTLILSASLRQSQESFRRVLDLYRTLQTPIPTQAESALRLEFGNGSRIISLPGTESTVRGYSGVRLLVIDEAARVSDDLYYSVRPMLAVSQGRLLALSTP